VEETAFAIGAFCVAAAIIGGGLKAAHIWEIPVVDSVPRQVLLGVFGVVLMVWGAMASGSGSPGNNGPNPTSTDPDPRPTATSPASTGAEGCQITIGNELAMLKEEPDTFSNTVMRIPAGTYPVEAIENVQFGPENQRWFRITVDGRTGFVRDDTFNIASKSDDCP
jgi:hypothetical protein